MSVYCGWRVIGLRKGPGKHSASTEKWPDPGTMNLLGSGTKLVSKSCLVFIIYRFY
jgi:hypothetical protein